MSIKRLENLPSMILFCENCIRTFNATIYSRAFTDDEEFICIDCGLLLFVSRYDPVLKWIMTQHYLVPRLLPNEDYSVLNDYLIRCDCGGSFAMHGRRYVYYRCPLCKKIMPEPFLVAQLCIDEEAWKSNVPFCCNVLGDGEIVEYTNPGLETIGFLDREFNKKWKRTIAIKGYQEALKKNDEMQKEIEKM